MRQLVLEFPNRSKIPPPKVEPMVSVVQNKIGETVHKNIAPKKNEEYSFTENIPINGKLYSLKVSSKINEGAYTYDREKGEITAITFRLIGEEGEYRFKIGISEYTIKQGHERYQDDSLGEYLGNISIGYIHKLDGIRGGARFINKKGEVIKNFDYFKYLFGGTPVHQILIPILKRVILDIERKCSQQGEK